ncbi:TetR/AcrR family transcriptional regulator [Actinoplanes sp. NPDC051411]|uniref:TetR/AcrR family transcriptional regulator n=1 Tax=Actinoplanes sp. NPDC051411 TaxID=3155522 RepID=UPI003439DDD1
MPSDTHEQDRQRLLDAAEALFYGRGIQAVGMDRLRAESRLPLKRIYQLFPGKDEMIVAFLRRRHERMMASIQAFLVGTPPGEERVLAIFEWLRDWFREPDFRGCPWMNAYGELGPTNAAVAAEVHHHQREFRQILTRVPASAGYPKAVADAIYLLVEGAVVAASVQHTPAPASEARQAAEILLAATARPPAGSVPASA